MPTFYWVGRGCPKDGTASSSHLWGTSEYNWNNPSNWIVAHSLHYTYLPRTLGNDRNTAPYAPDLTILTEVYAYPSRCPGPGDTVYIGHFPWLRHAQYNNGGTLDFSMNPTTGPKDTVIGVNDIFTNANAWRWDISSSMPGYWSANGLSRGQSVDTMTVMQILYAPINSSNGKVTTVNVPKALEGTSTIPLYKKFYATNSKSLNGGYAQQGITNYSKLSEWWDGPSTWINGVQPVEQVNEVDVIATQLQFTMLQRNKYRTYGDPKNNPYPTWYTHTSFVKLPQKAEAPLLWGGCVAGSTGVTSANGISGGSGNTFWQNAGPNGTNLLATANQALDEVNIIMYSDTLPNQRNSGISGGLSGTSFTFFDPYPFKSFGDGLFGEEHNTVVDNLKLPLCTSPTGGPSTYIPSNTCYNCLGSSLTGRAANLDRILSKSLTAEGERAKTVFIKAHNINVRTPHEYNKYAASNPFGWQKVREDITPFYRYLSEVQTGSTTLGNSWQTRQYHHPSKACPVGEPSGPDCYGKYGAYMLAGMNQDDKYVELRVADFFDYGMTATPEYMKTVVHAQMRYGQFNMTYGRVQELNLGIPYASYGNEYAEAPNRFYGLAAPNPNDIWPSLIEFTTLTESLNLYNTRPNSARALADATTFIRSENNSTKFGSANPYWTSRSTNFVGSNNTSDPKSRVNKLNSFSTSLTVNPMSQIGVSRIFAAIGDTVEFAGECLTAMNSNPYDYTKDMGSIFVNHGYCQIWDNGDGFFDYGKFLYGSPLTGNGFYAPYIKMSPINIIGIANQGGVSGSMDEGIASKTTYMSPIFNSMIGDLSLDNTDLIFLPPENINSNDISKYGNKIIDRVFAKNDVTINHREDKAGYLHFGRILSSSGGGTGSVYGGVIFQSENNQYIMPPEGARYWISRIDGGIVDTRQSIVPATFVATNYPEGKLNAFGNFPNSIVNGAAQSTGKNLSAYSENEIFRGKYDNLVTDEVGSVEDTPVAD